MAAIRRTAKQVEKTGIVHIAANLCSYSPPLVSGCTRLPVLLAAENFNDCTVCWEGKHKGILCSSTKSVAHRNASPFFPCGATVSAALAVMPQDGLHTTLHRNLPYHLRGRVGWSAAELPMRNW